ncbi:MAG: NAD(P)/FAD-dependent oxidoreductase [Nitrospirota bacterium]
MREEKLYDCLIIGAGPGGLQAAIYLGRCNFEVLLIDRTGGRTWHAKHIENYFGHRLVTGEELITTGIEQAKQFGTRVERGQVIGIRKRDTFEVDTHTDTCRARFVIVSSGVYDILPPLENLYTFFGDSFHTCIDCDGYRTTGKKIVVMGDGIEAVNHAFAMKEMYTGDITVVVDADSIPPEYEEELSDEGIPLVKGEPVKLLGGEHLEAVELSSGERIPCEAVMSTYGYRRNDDFLSGLELKKNQRGYYVTSRDYESSLSGLYIVGPLNTGHDQVVIAAGEGAVAALDIKRAVLEQRKMAFFTE